jgi:Rieske 2Fe-2S family protein
MSSSAPTVTPTPSSTPGGSHQSGEPRQESRLRPGLGRAAFVDPDVFETERRLVFGRTWNCVGRSAVLEQPGAFFTSELAGESILVVRQADGSLRAVRNLCRHRGARLCLEESGTFGRTIRCPYHSWTYGTDGRLLSAPNMREMPDLDKSERSLLSLAVEEWAGYAWVRLEGDGALGEQLEPQLLARFGSLDTLRRYAPDRLEVGATIVYDVASNWKAVIENFMECYHCSTLHPELTAALPEFASGYGTVAGGVGHGATLAPGVEGFTRSHRAARAPLPGLGPEDVRIFHGVVLLPNVLVVLVPDHVAFLRIEPVGPSRTTVRAEWLFDPDEVAREGFDPSDSVELLDLTNRQDFSACERVQLGAESSPAFETVLTPPEEVVVGFHEWVTGLLGFRPDQPPRATVESP